MFQEINGKKMAVDVFGEGEPMLLVHGLGGSSNLWRPLINEFSGQFKLIVPDLPCAARSSNDPNLSISSLATDMLALLDSLDIGQAHLVGHSMGTIVCQHMAVMAPLRISDLVLLGPVGQVPESARGAIKDRAALAREHGMESIADATATTALSADTKQSNSNAQGFVREMIIRQDPEGYALSCIALSESKQANLDSVTCPCLLITGDEDVVAPPRNVELLSGQIAKSELHILDKCGHWTPTERPKEVNALMNAFYSA